MYTFKDILVAIDENRIATITINRAEKLNALNAGIIREIGNAVSQLESDANCGGIILTGSGPKAFVAGADISEFANYTKEEGMALAKAGQDIFRSIENCSKPVLAAVNGFALGGGCELAMACHMRVASDNAKFGQPEVNLGILPGYGGTQRLPLLIGRGKALELLMTGDMIGAEEAVSLGLANHVVAQDELIAFSKKLMGKILSKAPLAIAKVISAVNR
ncbi:UNVERIFIED_CONTAM: hypothetical protein GTU68_008465, partial [Idotea baltica]|nr:hypothetical protein [Idotea baltica]